MGTAVQLVGPLLKYRRQLSSLRTRSRKRSDRTNGSRLAAPFEFLLIG